MPVRSPPEQRQHLYRLVFAICKEIGVTDTERHEWGERLTGVEGGSMTRMDLGQLRVFVEQLRGAQTFCELMILRPAKPINPRVLPATMHDLQTNTFRVRS